MYHDTLLSKFIEKMYKNVAKLEQQDVDPPIPPGIYKYNILLKNKTVDYVLIVVHTYLIYFAGAIKLNYSTRLSSLVLRFCDKDIDLIEIKILGFENNCIYNANERMVLRAYLRSIVAEDLHDDTLYSKVII